MMTRSSHSRSTTSSWCEENSTAALRGALGEDAGDDVDGERIEARERLVEDQHLGVVHERGGDLRALLIAERERLDVVAEALAETELLEQGARAGPASAAEAVQAGEVDDVLEHLHLRVEAALLGHVAEAAPVGRGHPRAAEGDGAAVPGEHAQDDPHRRRLARAVAADEARSAAGGDGERHVVEHAACRSSW
jgi:hypothetical protein